MRIPPTPFALLFVFSLPFLTNSQDHDTTHWFKGNTHTHSLWSDGNDFPEMIIDFYHKNGYDFVALSDHNVLQIGEKWMDVAAIKKRQRAIGRDAITKCEARFGKDWIQWETREEKKGIVLKTLDQCREVFEKPGEFYLLTAEEVSNMAKGGAPVHINALNLAEVIPAVKDKEASVAEVMARSLGMIAEAGEKTGRPILAHLNHPNFQWAITADDLAKVAQGGFVEIYNGHPGINHLGDATRPGDVEVWDIANTIRIAEMNLPPLLGVATDDSHTYHGGDVSPGRGWVVVGAEKLDGDSIVQAMQGARFYASSGVELTSISFNRDSGELSVEAKPEDGVEYTFDFIGTRKGYDAAAEETGIGEVFVTAKGNAASFRIPQDALYLRVTVTSSRRHPNPSFPGQKEQAWTQPMGWKTK
ncbi:MAG: hypothetical protein P1U85_01405 [Verrucomicrobiales bacterium]|nr:hypothetical protein [Verrucomicrobiales bacterium]